MKNTKFDKITTRIDHAVTLPGFCEMYKSEIIANYCPFDIDPTLPDVDEATFYCNTYITFDGQGCCGINCMQCWLQEYKVLFKTIKTNDIIDTDDTDDIIGVFDTIKQGRSWTIKK